jgi:catechol 2,3-dioxygenase-like lactoylglutathione lyase family enzyme
MPRITTASVMVDDQAKALAFYTDVLGFQVKTDIPVGEFRWLTVVSPEVPDGVELLLEPDEHPAAKPFKEALVADGIPLTSFGVDDVDAVHDDLVAKGVTIVQPPTNMGPVRTLILDDTCGNYIQLAEMTGEPPTT